MEFNEQLQELRKKKGLTQEELADSRKGVERIRFTNKISGMYFGKNPYNIHILSRIFPSSILTDL